MVDTTPSEAFISVRPVQNLPPQPAARPGAEITRVSTNLSSPPSNAGLFVAIAVLAVVAVVLLGIVIWLAVTRPDCVSSASSGRVFSGSFSGPAPGPRYEVFIYNPPTAGQTYAFGSLAEAITGCQSLTPLASVATTAQLEAAFNDPRGGANWCTAGWLADGTAKYPMQAAVSQCSTGRGIISWSGPRAGANCYGVKPPQGAFPGVQPFNDGVPSQANRKWSEYD